LLASPHTTRKIPAQRSSRDADFPLLISLELLDHRTKPMCELRKITLRKHWSRTRPVSAPTTVPTFNAAFSLSGTVTPEPTGTVGVLIGLGFIGYRRWRAVTR
jgi:hypothetical protein